MRQEGGKLVAKYRIIKAEKTEQRKDYHRDHRGEQTLTQRAAEVSEKVRTC
jgi:hypothetical protein